MMSAAHSFLVLFLFVATALGDPIQTKPYVAPRKQIRNQCKLYATDMAYYGGKAAVMGCSADLVLACKKELYHFDAYNVHAFGGSAHVEYVDVAGYGAKNFYIIGVNINCKYTGKVEVRVEIPGIHIPTIHFQKLPCTPVKSTGSVNDYNYKKHAGNLHFASDDGFYDPFEHSYGSSKFEEHKISHSQARSHHLQHEPIVYHDHTGPREGGVHSEGQITYAPHGVQYDQHKPRKQVAHVPLYHEHEVVHPVYKDEQDKGYQPAKPHPYAEPVDKEDDWYDAYIHKHHPQEHDSKDSFQAYTPSGYIEPPRYPKEQQHSHDNEPHHYEKVIQYPHTSHVEPNYRNSGNNLHHTYDHRAPEHGSDYLVQKRDTHYNHLPSHPVHGNHQEHSYHGTHVPETKKYDDMLKSSHQPWVELPSVPKPDHSQHHEEASPNGYSPIKMPDLRAYVNSSPFGYGK